jgi:vitamin B12 transporter
MFASLVYRFRFIFCLAIVLLFFAFTLRAQSGGSLRGKIADSLGTPVPNARITVLQGSTEIAHGQSGTDGSFDLAVPATGNYSLQVEATGFAALTLPPVHVAAGRTVEQPVTLQVGALAQHVVVSATGTAISQAQVGATTTVIDNSQIQTMNKLDVLEDLRVVPGVQVVQTGQRGGQTSLFVQGGESNFNKVLVDGVPVNEIGGDFDFAQLSDNGVGNVEVLRGANSVVYGSDALSGVVNITSPHGTTTVPELTYSADGGNFGTVHQEATIGGIVHGLDYFTDYSDFDTNGNIHNDAFHNETISGNVGWQLNPTTGIRATVRYTATDVGLPNAFLFFGISDASWQRNRNTYAGVTAQQQTTQKWHNSIQFAFAQLGYVDDTPAPTGEPFDPFAGTSFDSGPNYLGNVVTIKGANGYSVTGQAILDFGDTYPDIFGDYEARRSVDAQSEYQFTSDWTGIFGFRYEHEDGDGITRNVYSGYMQGQGSIAHRFFATFGVGLEQNSFFGFAATPRVSLAYYLRKPSNQGVFGETKLKFNFGTGIEEADTFEQASALINLLTPAQITQYSVQPIGPERSRTFDTGIEQRLWNGRSLLGVTLYYNDFYNLISFLGEGDLISIGVPPAVAATAEDTAGGAYVNATSERMKGAEVEYKMDLGHGLLFQGDYTYLDGLVTRSFGDPSYNPDFPNIPIGAFDPLEGQRPFRRAPNSGSVALFYNHKKFTGSFTGYMVSRRDDSTFLDDGYFGNTMLLPNRNLAPGYQKFDLSGSYVITPYAKIYTSVENLFSEHYQQEFGYPGLPFTIRAGMTFTLGGKEGWWK